MVELKILSQLTSKNVVAPPQKVTSARPKSRQGLVVDLTLENFKTEYEGNAILFDTIQASHIYKKDKMVEIPICDTTAC